MNKLYVTAVKSEQDSVEICYRVEGDWSSYFSELRAMKIQYSTSIEQVSNSIKIIPFICNILPLVWLTNADVYIDEIDSDFFYHIQDIKKGYMKMYPSLTFLGNIIPKQIENNKNNYSTGDGSSACFFSGGVDAYTTLFRHIEESPYLITIWGADIFLNDKTGWNNAYKHVCDVSKEFGLKSFCIKSNFRYMLDEKKLNKFCIDLPFGGSWWHEFQHGIAIISHASILAPLLNLKTIYIASSNTSDMQGNYTCASDPLIDNNVHFCGCATIHDGYELDRQAKVSYLLKKNSELNKHVFLRVCYNENADGYNCCHCEKCYRTILEIVSEGADPNLYGFKWDRKHIKKCKKDMLGKIQIPQFCVEQYYERIVERFLDNKAIIPYYDDYLWLIKFDLSKFNETIGKKFRHSSLFKVLRVVGKPILVNYKKIVKKIFRTP